MALRFDPVENPKTIPWPKPKLPFRAERHWLLQGPMVSGFYIGLEEQLSLDLGLDQAMVFRQSDVHGICYRRCAGRWQFHMKIVKLVRSKTYPMARP